METVQEKAKCEASENKQLKRRLEEHSQEIESLELYIEKLENSINISTQVLENIQIQHREAIKNFSLDKTLLQKETTKWQSKFNTISASLNETTTKLEDAKNKLSKYNIRNVNKKHKRLNEKYVSTMNENKVLQEHVKENEQEIENLNEKVNEKQETYEKIVENLDSSEEKVNVLKLEKHKLQKRLCGLRINSNKRKSFLVEKHEAEIQVLKNEISEHNIRISELEQLNTLLKVIKLSHLKMESTQMKSENVLCLL